MSLKKTKETKSSRGEGKTLWKQVRLRIQASVPGLGRNNPLLASAACNHPLPSSITIIYLEAGPTVGECSVRNNAGGVTPVGLHWQVSVIPAWVHRLTTSANTHVGKDIPWENVLKRNTIRKRFLIWVWGLVLGGFPPPGGILWLSREESWKCKQWVKSKISTDLQSRYGPQMCWCICECIIGLALVDSGVSVHTASALSRLMVP